MTLRESIKTLVKEYSKIFEEAEKKYGVDYIGGYNLVRNAAYHKAIFDMQQALKEDEQEGGE